MASSLNEKQRKRVLKLIDMLEGNNGELVLHILDMEDEFEKAMEDLKVFAEVAKDVRRFTNEITPKAGEHFPTRGELNAQIRELFSKIPLPKDADEKKMVKKITKDLKKSLKVRHGRDAIVDYDFLVTQVLSKIILPEPGKDGSPDNPEDIANKLESIEEEDKKLNMSAVEGLLEALKEVRKIANAQRGGGGTPFYKTMIDDFSDDTDGSTKVFTLSRQPRKANTVMVWGSDFPTILRPTTDFTIAGKTLTLTAELDAPTTGSTLICQYVT